MNRVTEQPWIKDHKMNKEQPWLDEPDFVKWIDPTTGYVCVVRRVYGLMHLCGYVRVPRSHPLYRKQYDCGKVGRVRVHGGLTFAGRATRLSGARLLGHWFGFDCAHYGDLVPGLPDAIRDVTEETYRDMAYVKDQTTLLANQLKAKQ